MSGVALRLAAELRRRWVAWLAVGVVIGLGMGVVLALAAGARRTETAYDRFLSGANPSDLVIQESADFGPSSIDLEAVQELPELSESTITTGFFSFARLENGTLIAPGRFFTMSDPRGVQGRVIDRGRILEGRRPRPGRLDEVVVGFDLARQWGLHAGDSFELGFAQTETALGALAEFAAGIPDRLSTAEVDTYPFEDAFVGLRSTFEVVGIAADPLGFPPQSGSLIPLVYLSPEFAGEHDDLFSQRFLYGQLADGVSAADFESAVANAFPEAQVRILASGESQARSVQRVIDLDARALGMLAGVLAITVAIVALQLIARLTVQEDGEHDALLALGASRSFFVGLAASRALLIALPVVAVGGLVAVLASARFPIGIAGVAEPNRGVAVDLLVVAIGVLLVVVTLPAGAALTMRRRIRRPKSARGGDRIPASFRRLPPAIETGVIFARSSAPGGAAVPVRSSVLVLATATGSLVLLLTFAAGLFAFLDNPRAYGWNWDLQLGYPGVPDLHEALGDGLERDSAVRSFAHGTVVALEADGERVDALAVEDVQGAIRPSMIDGEPPVQAREVALGSLTMDSLSLSIGDTVTMGIGNRTAEFAVTGEVVLPELGDDGQLGRGAFVPLAGLEGLVADPERNVLLVVLDPVAPRAASIANIDAAITPYPLQTSDDGNELLAVTEVADSKGATTLTLLAAPLLVTIATVLHVLVTSIRRRRRDLAILRTLGFGRRHILTVVVSQASTLLLSAVMIGIPIGVVAGRLLWTAFADSLGVPAPAVVPVGPIAAGAVLLVVLAALISLVPGAMAGRNPAVEALRME